MLDTVLVPFECQRSRETSNAQSRTSLQIVLVRVRRGCLSRAAKTESRGCGIVGIQMLPTPALLWIRAMERASEFPLSFSFFLLPGSLSCVPLCCLLEPSSCSASSSSALLLSQGVSARRGTSPRRRPAVPSLSSCGLRGCQTMSLATRPGSPGGGTTK